VTFASGSRRIPDIPTYFTFRECGLFKSAFRRRHKGESIERKLAAYAFRTPSFSRGPYCTRKNTRVHVGVQKGDIIPINAMQARWSESNIRRSLFLSLSLSCIVVIPSNPRRQGNLGRTPLRAPRTPRYYLFYWSIRSVSSDTVLRRFLSSRIDGRFHAKRKKIISPDILRSEKPESVASPVGETIPNSARPWYTKQIAMMESLLGGRERERGKEGANISMFCGKLSRLE